MGRHRAPGTGKPEPDTGFWVRVVAVVVGLLLVGAYALTRDNGGTTTATPTTQETSTAPTTTTAPTATTSSPPPSPTPTPTPTEKPPTLSFKVLAPSYITVRIPGGRTLVSRTFRKGETRSFDQKVLEVVNGRPRNVRFEVNGKPRKPGPADRPETFIARRR